MNLENLKKARKETGLTQKEVADKLGVNYTTYRNYEQGQREPNHRTLAALSNLLNVSTDNLLGKEDPLEILNLSPVGKAIVQLYISLSPEERTALAEHIKAISNGADVQLIIKKSEVERNENDEYIIQTTTVGAELDRREAEQANALSDAESEKSAV